MTKVYRCLSQNTMIAILFDDLGTFVDGEPLPSAG